MNRLAAPVGFGLSAAILAARTLESSAAPWIGPEVSVTALVLCVWVALAGLPGRDSLGWMGTLGLALPTTALALAADRLAGRSWDVLAPTALAALGMAALLAEAARRSGRAAAAGDPEALGGWVYGPAWFSSVLIPALSSGGWSQDPAATPSDWFAYSPLGWVFLRADADAGARGPWVALAICAVLLALTAGGARRAETGGAERAGTGGAA